MFWNAPLLTGSVLFVLNSSSSNNLTAAKRLVNLWNYVCLRLLENLVWISQSHFSQFSWLTIHSRPGNMKRHNFLHWLDSVFSNLVFHMQHLLKPLLYEWHFIKIIIVDSSQLALYWTNGINWRGNYWGFTFWFTGLIILYV